jgi:hypothetical protein
MKNPITMKIGNLFILLSILNLATQAQTKILSRSSSQYSIKWSEPIKISMLEGQNAKTLAFEGADYVHSDHFLPRYYQHIDLNNETDFSAIITDAVYVPLTETEKNIVSSQNNISSEIKISTTTSITRKKAYGIVSFIPLRHNKTTGNYEKLVSFNLAISPGSQQKASSRSIRTYAANSVLQSGTWYKISTTTDGIYKLSYSFLASLGINMSSVNPQNLRVYGNGGGMLAELNSVPRIDDLAENAIYVQDNGNGIFDPNEYALFYGTAPNSWSFNPSSCPKFSHQTNLYSDSAFYFITFDLGPGKRIQNQASSSATATHIVTSFDDYAFTENNSVNLIHSGRQWFGEHFDNISTYSFSYSFPNVDMLGLTTVKTQVASRYQDPAGSGNSLYNVSCQSGNTIIIVPEITGSDYDDYANIESGCFSFNPTNPNPTLTVNVTKQTSGATGWLDFIEVNARRKLIMNGTQMAFRDSESFGPGNVTQYNLTSSSPIEVWDITDPVNIRKQTTVVSGTNYQFTLPSDTLRKFIAFSGSDFNTPARSERVMNQDLHAIGKKDMIIVAYPNFVSQANQLASHHESHDSLSTVVVTTKQIYNEFSSGSTDASAIRDFVKMFYDRAASPSDIPDYLLLFGDGSYNNKGKGSNTNFIPTYQSFNSTVPTTSYVSDDFFGLLDDTEGFWSDIDNDAVDIGIGRFPVKTTAEAQSAVDKVLAYNRAGIPPMLANSNSCTSASSSPFGDWRNIICFVADDEDNNLHQIQANSLATRVDTVYNNYNIDKIFFDAYKQEATPGGNRYPEVNAAINKRVEKGALIINYTGHGGEVGLAHERVVEVSDINRWKNINNMPLFFTATCEFSRYDDPDRTSAGEYVFLNPNGGGIALLSTVRLVFASPNFTLNQNFYNSAFVPVNGKMPRLGDLYRYIKTQSGGNSVNSRNFTLLGDPALQLAYPKFDVSTDSVNMNPVSTSINDTVKALSLVSVSGYIRDKSGVILSNYNGVLYPTVFDKQQNITTLSNDGPGQSPPMVFKIQKNILYKGKVSVTNGYFKFNFIVPKDIAYQFGPGRISYYAENGTEDANGYYERIIIGGSNDSAAIDNTGPEVQLYMNDTKFAFGGLTNENPDLYAILKDQNGINTVGNGIGHDVTATLDANTEHAIVLNDYYQADLNSYKSGSIRYPFTELSEGKHTLDFKAWDVYNNSSKAYTEFIVAKSAELALSHVLNYPNPFTTKTSFYFEQNQCCQSLEVELQIFTISGKLVKNLSQFVYTEGFRSSPIEWDGRDDFGDKIGKGVYIYKLKVKTGEGQSAEKFEKLVILN